MRVWAEAWDVFRRAPSRVGRGGRAAVDFVVCFGLGGFLSDFFSFLMRQGRENEATEAVFYLQAKKPLHNEARPRERSDRGRFLPIGKKASSYRGAYRVPLFN